jgi:DNA-binding NtrC family response regulator
MATILLLGHDAALLEGLAQTLAAVGHKPVLAGSLGEAHDILGSETPLVAVIDRAIAKGSGDALRVPLLPGGAVVLYRSLSDVGGLLPPALQRMTLADLTLPLERQRLVALVQHVESRANHTGRGRRTTPPGGPRADESPDPRS